MWQILCAPFWKFSKLCNGGIYLNWSTTDEVITHDTAAYFFWPTLYIHTTKLCLGSTNPRADFGDKVKCNRNVIAFKYHRFTLNYAN